MVQISIDKLKNSPKIIKDIRWDVTPQIFLNPRSSPDKEAIDITYGYMLYVDLINDRPTLLIMQLKKLMSKTVASVNDVSEDLLKDAMHCTDKECVAGMYPLSEKLESWLKKELNLPG